MGRPHERQHVLVEPQVERRLVPGSFRLQHALEVRQRDPQVPARRVVTELGPQRPEHLVAVVVPWWATNARSSRTRRRRQCGSSICSASRNNWVGPSNATVSGAPNATVTWARRRRATSASDDSVSASTSPQRVEPVLTGHRPERGGEIATLADPSVGYEPRREHCAPRERSRRRDLERVDLARARRGSQVPSRTAVIARAIVRRRSWSGPNSANSQRLRISGARTYATTNTNRRPRSTPGLAAAWTRRSSASRAAAAASSCAATSTVAAQPATVACRNGSASAPSAVRRRPARRAPVHRAAAGLDQRGDDTGPEQIVRCRGLGWREGRKRFRDVGRATGQPVCAWQDQVACRVARTGTACATLRGRQHLAGQARAVCGHHHQEVGDYLPLGRDRAGVDACELVERGRVVADDVRDEPACQLARATCHRVPFRLEREPAAGGLRRSGRAHHALGARRCTRARRDLGRDVAARANPVRRPVEQVAVSRHRTDRGAKPRYRRAANPPARCATAPASGRASRPASHAEGRRTPGCMRRGSRRVFRRRRRSRRRGRTRARCRRAQGSARRRAHRLCAERHRRGRRRGGSSTVSAVRSLHRRP